MKILITENQLKNIIVNENTNNTTINSLKNELNKIGVKPGQKFELTDKNGKKQTMTLNNNGEIIQSTNKSEISEKEKILPIIPVIAACFVLASGLVSCSKGPGGFGYNVNVKTIKYDLTKGDRTKEITVITPNGERTEKVNPSDTTKGIWSGHGMHVEKAPTPEELQITAFGSAIQREEKSNSGRGYDVNRYVMDVTKAEIKREVGYEESPNSGGPLPSIKQYPEYVAGIKLIQKYPKYWAEFKLMNPVEEFKP